MARTDAMTRKEGEKQLFQTLSVALKEATITPHVELYLGLICNIKCPYCYLPYKKRLADEIPIETLLPRLKSLGLSNVEVLGGEPFVYKTRLSYLLDFSFANNVSITAMSTNGLVYDQDIVDKLKRSGIGYLQVSLDAATSKTYSVVRCEARGLFEKAIGNIKRFVENCIPISLSFVIMKPNMDEISDFVYLAKALGVKRVSFGTIVPVGEGRNVTKWFLTQAEYDKVSSKIKEMQLSLNGEIEIIFNNDNDATGSLCSAGVNKVAILPNGDIYACGLFIEMPQFKLGNINGGIDDEVLMKIFKNEEIDSSDYWKKCVACKVSVGGNSVKTNNSKMYN